MNRAGFIDEAVENVLGRARDAFSVFGDYLFIGEVWVGVVILALAAGYIAFFVPWQWVRGMLGSAVAIAIAAAVGAQLMFNRMRGQTKPLRDRVQELEHEKRDKDNRGSWF